MPSARAISSRSGSDALGSDDGLEDARVVARELGTNAAPAEDGRGLLGTVERVQILGEPLVVLGPRRNDQPRLPVG